MSDTSQGPGWWIASDGKWYPPESAQPPTPPPPAPPAYTPPPAYPPPAYAPPPYAPPMGSVAPTAQEALWAMILGIASLVCCGFILGIPAIILGSNAKKKIASSGGTLGGEEMAKAGVIMGWVSVGFSVLALAAWVLILIFGSSTSTTYYNY